ncbi:MAG: acyl carrier protein [Kiritimatiellae bacterium]|nr:acyl carrier protein [Kiritimatiellia bacterium]
MDRDATIAKIKETIVSSLDLEDVKPADIVTDDPLFGEGLGLDSIDALELGMALKKTFGIVFSKDPAKNKQIFRSVATIADYIIGETK